MIYEQLLSPKGTKPERVKRAFQIIGLLHFLLWIGLFVLFMYIYWRWSLITLIILFIGLLWGSIAYVFSFEYKYLFKDGTFIVYKLNSHGKFVIKLQCNTNQIEFVPQQKSIKMTNKKECLYIKVNGEVYRITPDDYMYALLNSKSNSAITST